MNAEFSFDIIKGTVIFLDLEEIKSTCRGTRNAHKLTASCLIEMLTGKPW